MFLRTARQLSKKSKSPSVFASAFAFLLNTGLRAGELCFLTWNDIDLKERLLFVQQKDGWTPKTGPRVIPLNDIANQIVSEQPNSGTWVFTSNDRQLTPNILRKVLLRIAKAAELHNFTRVHDLRHLFASQLEMSGVDRGTVAHLLGHKSISTTELYSHRTDEHL